MGWVLGLGDLLRQPGGQLSKTIDDVLQTLRVGDQQDTDDEKRKRNLGHGAHRITLRGRSRHL